MSESDAVKEAPKAGALVITKELLKEWEACRDGYGWFLAKFPQGGDVHEVGAALRTDKRYGDARWLVSHVFDSFIEAPGIIADYVDGDVAHTIKDASIVAEQKTANGSSNSSEGYSSTAASSGNSSTAASSGNSSTAEASGEKTVAIVAGRNGKARAGEKGAFALAWLDGEQMRITVGVVGENGINADTWYRVSDDGILVESE